MAGFYIQDDNGTEVGPMTALVLKRMAETGRITPESLVCKEGSEKWVRAEKVKGLTFGEPEPEPEPEPEAEAESEPAFHSDLPTEFIESRVVVSEAYEPPQESAWEPQRTVVASLPSEEVPQAGFWGKVGDVFGFHSMLTPFLIKFCFALGLVAGVAAWLTFPIYTVLEEGFSEGMKDFLRASALLPLGMAVWRVLCEWLIILFKINENLIALREELPSTGE